MNDTDLNDLISILQLHTALGRIGHAELITAIKFAEAQGYVFSKASTPMGQKGAPRK
jgi:hypothetical protein